MTRHRSEARITAGANEHHHDLYRALEDAALSRGGIPVDTEKLHGGYVDFQHQISVRQIAWEWLRSQGITPTEFPVRDAYRVSLEGRKNQRNLVACNI
jgi:hypothetical protein